MTALVLLSVPSEKSKIKLVPQNAIMNVALGKAFSGLSAYDLAQCGKGAVAVSIKGKDAFHDFGVFGVYFDVALDLIVAITEGGAAWVDTLRGLFLHALFDFLAQVLDVIAGDQKLKAVHQFSLRLGILVEDLAFLGQVNFHS